MNNVILFFYILLIFHTNSFLVTDKHNKFNLKFDRGFLVFDIWENLVLLH